MRSRYLAAAAALWALGYAVGYVAVIREQEDGSVARWYLAVVLFAAIALSTYAVGVAGKPAAIGGFLLLAGAALLGALSIGVFLLPGVAAAGLAVASHRPATAPA